MQLTLINDALKELEKKINLEKEIYFNCRICGYKQNILPWGGDNRTPTYNVCDCCGGIFGIDDIDKDKIKKNREAWLKNGATWFNLSAKPINWNLELQIVKAPPIE